MNYKVVHVIKNEKRSGKDGKEYQVNYYAFEFDNGSLALFNPSSSSDYPKIDTIAEKRYVGFPPKESK